MKSNYLIVVSEFHRQVTDRLLAGAQQAFNAAGVGAESCTIVWVPGAFELPLVALQGARLPRFQGVVCLGCVIRGETPHFEYVCRESARGIMNVSLETGKPVGFGLLTVDRMEQALARCETDGRGNGSKEAGMKKQIVTNKGFEAANTVLAMVQVTKNLQENFVTADDL